MATSSVGPRGRADEDGKQIDLDEMKLIQLRVYDDDDDDDGKENTYRLQHRC